MFTNGGKGGKKTNQKIKEKIRVHSCSFVANILFLERHIYSLNGACARYLASNSSRKPS
jgi:hypothetical protein